MANDSIGVAAAPAYREDRIFQFIHEVRMQSALTLVADYPCCRQIFGMASMMPFDGSVFVGSGIGPWIITANDRRRSLYFSVKDSFVRHFVISHVSVNRLSIVHSNGFALRRTGRLGSGRAQAGVQRCNRFQQPS